MLTVVADIEANGLNPSKIHCIVCKRQWASSTRKRTHSIIFTDLRVYSKATRPLKEFKNFTKEVGTWVFHNGLAYDVPVINRIYGEQLIDPKRVIDTFVVSKTVDYKKFMTHSLREWGEYLKIYKVDYSGGWDEVNSSMVDYCIQDVEVTEAIYSALRAYIADSHWKKALRVEHDMATICHEIGTNGFNFDIDKCEKMHLEVCYDMAKLEDSFYRDFPPVLVEDRRLKVRRKKDTGQLFAPLLNTIATAPKVEFSEDGSELIVFEYKTSKPSSAKDRINILHQAGWKPKDKTVGHIKFLRGRGPKDKEKQEKFAKYGWKCNEANLSTLPPSAPQPAKDLAKWLTLEGVRSTLAEWLKEVSREDGRMHGKFWHIGAWTHRMSHSKPNSANIASPFHGKPTSPVEEVKAKYAGAMRSLWLADEGEVLVGTDADGIQLRILAHLMKSESYKEAILKGDKDKGTDIHSLNMKALGPVCKDRYTAKTFIYAFLLGAGTAKVADILSCSMAQAKEAVENFTKSIDGLKRLKEVTVPRAAALGYFIGLDGRRVKCDSEHFMLAGMLQNAEAVIMKHACVKWNYYQRNHKVPYKLVNFVHDEWQTTCPEGSASVTGHHQRSAIRNVGEELDMFIPLAGSTDVGANWLETH